MTDITPDFNRLLKAKEAPLVTRHVYSIDQLDEFLKEAYRIQARISDLTRYLKANRPAYLSTVSASRRARNDAFNTSRNSATQRPLTDKERAEIDAHSKMMIRQLNGAITSLADAEKVRQETASLLATRKRNKAGLGALGRWAAGDVQSTKTRLETAQESKDKTLNAHREGVIFHLQKNLGVAGQIQAGMIEIRLQREEEKAKSVLYKAKGTRLPGGGTVDPGLLPKQDRSSKAALDSNLFLGDDDQHLSEEQVQLFAEENQGMLKHLGQQLDQVKAVHRSLEEISQLQTSLMTNLETQNAQIDQLVQDSFLTEENVGKGNKELKRASEKTSTARLLFHGTCAFCTFLVVWDLIF